MRQPIRMVAIGIDHNLRTRVFVTPNLSKLTVANDGYF